MSCRQSHPGKSSEHDLNKNGTRKVSCITEEIIIMMIKQRDCELWIGEKIQILRVMKQNILSEARQAELDTDVSERIFQDSPHDMVYTRKKDCMSSRMCKSSKNPENIIINTYWR